MSRWVPAPPVPEENQNDQYEVPYERMPKTWAVREEMELVDR